MLSKAKGRNDRSMAKCKLSSHTRSRLQNDKNGAQDANVFKTPVVFFKNGIVIKRRWETTVVPAVLLSRQSRRNWIGRRDQYELNYMPCLLPMRDVPLNHWKRYFSTIKLKPTMGIVTNSRCCLVDVKVGNSLRTNHCSFVSRGWWDSRGPLIYDNVKDSDIDNTLSIPNHFDRTMIPLTILTN